MKTFSEHINSGKPVIVDFFAEWYGPCRMMTPVLEKVKQQVGDNAVILKVDIDKNPAVASAYSIKGVPALLLFKDGVMKWRQAGVVSAIELQQMILLHM